MSYQRQATTAPTTVTATSGPNQTTRFNSGSSTSSSIMGLINSPNSHQSARTSTPSRLLDELLALGSRANNCQQPNLSNIEKQQHQSNITIIDYRQSQGAAPPTTSSLLFRNTGASFDGGASSKMDQQRSTFDQFASQFKASLGLGGGGGGGGGGEKRRTRPTETPPATGSNSCSSTSGAQPPPPVLLLQQPSLLTGNVKILDIRRTKTNRRRPKAADANESVAPIQLAYEDEVEDDSDGDGDGDYNNDDDASAVQLAADHQQRQQQQQQQEQSATRNRSQTLTRHSQQQQQQPHQQQQQRQQSGETLSSFESDYDLLVYLGETETEDLVETERSLDYLDQTWRQSICGGASLAPTIDESLSELLTPTGTNQQQHQNQQRFAQITPTRTTPIDYNDDFDSLWTTPGNGQGVGGQTPAETSTLSSLYRQQRANRFNQPPNQPSNLLPDYSAYGAGGQLSASLPRQQNYYRHHQDEQQQQTNRRTGGPLTSAKTVTSTSGNNASPLPLETPRQFAGPVRGGRDLQAANFSKQLAEVQASGSNNNHHSQPIIDRTQQQQQQQTGQAPNSLAGNIGNKLVSLFGRNTKHHQQQQPQHSQRDNQDSFGAASESARQEAESVRQLNELLLLNQPSVTSANTQMAPQKPRRQQYAVAGGQAGGPSSTTRQHGIMDGNADELDRLLAEMSQSLDLDSLARYDPYANAGTAASQQRRQQQQLPNNQTHQSSYAPQLPATTSSGTSMRPQQLQKQAAQTEKVTNYDKMPLQTTNRNESILDEYDGASRMLEQMISDQLDEALAGVDAPRQQQHQLPSASISTGTTGMTTSDGPDTPLATTTSTSRQLASGEPIGGASVTSSSSARAQRFKLANKQGSSSRQTTITNHSSQATSDSEERASSVSQARKISTGSSATTETSVIPMHTAKSDQTRQQQHLLSQQRQALQRSDRSSGDDFDVARVGPNKSSSSSRERILAVHHHQSSLDETPRTTKKNPSSSSAAAKRPSQHHRYPLNYSRSLDVAAETSATQKTQPADSHRLPGKAAAPLPPAAAPAPEESRRQREPSAASIKSNSSTSSSSADTEPVPPVPPAVDYSDHYPDDGEENRSVPLATRRATTTTIQSPTKDNNNLRPSRTALSATQLAAQSPDRNQGGEQVIQVEANELPSPTSSDEDESGGGGKHKRVMSRMKRRTMSGVRSMRQRLNRHFSVGPEVKQQQQQQHKASVGPSEGAGRPEPPTRSSSIGSSRSGHSPRAGSKPGESSGSPRQSRQRERRPTSGTQASESMNKRTAPDELGPAVDSGKKSFGQQWRERLSRSKSRFSQFLRPLSSHRQRQDDDEHNQEHRAQSTPNDETTGRLQLDMFQPGDIARNEQQQTGKAGSASRPTRPTADESSLERQLRADLDKIRPPPPATTTTKTITLEPLPQTEKGNVHKPSTANITRQQSQSSDRSLASGDLDGLETTTGRRNQPLFGRRSARSSKRKSRTTPAQGKKHNQLASQTQKRPASLISLKRFSESFGRSPKLNTSDTEDLDSMKVKSSGDASTSANQQNLAGSSSRPKRNSRNKRLRNKSLGDQRPLEAAGHSPTSRLDILTPARATTDDYFGLRAPLKTAASSESPPPAIGSALVHQRVEMGPRVRPASAMLPAEADTTSEGDDHETRPDRHINHKLFAKRRPRVPPNRSQSLKSVDRPSVKSPSGEQHLTLGVSGSGDGDQQALTAKDSAGTGDARQKSVSFQNLSPATANQRRPLSPVSPNTFRPVSANPATTQTLEPDYHHHQTPTGAGADAGSITPIQLAPILANASTSSSSAGAAGTSERVASSKTTPVSTSRSPIRERGAALLDDLRNKYTDLFRSHQPSNRNEVHQLRPAGAPQSTGKPVDSAEAPPSRPPRHRKRRDRNQDQHRDHIVEPRSKSLAAAPSVTVIEVEPSSPPASLLLGVGDSPEPQQHQSDGPRRGGVKRLTSFAQQLKTSAADFFSSSGQHHHHHQPGGHGEPNKKSVVAAESGPQQQAGTTVDRRALLRSLDEPLIQNDLAEWRPIIPVSTKAASSSTRRRLQRSSSFKLPKDHLDESGGDRSRTLGDERDTADKSKGLDDDDDSDSTWDSGSSDTENDNDDDKHHANRIVPTQAHGVAQRAQASRRLDDSSTAAAAVASRTIDDDEQQQVADGLMRGGTNSHNRRQHTRQAGDLPLGSSALAQTNTNTNKNTNSASHSSPNSHRIVHAAIPAVAPTSLAIGTDKNNNDEHQASGNNNNNNRNSCNSNNNGVRGSVAESTRLQPQLATQSNQKHKHQLDHLAHQAQSKQATWQQSSTSANETTTTKLSNRFVPEQDDNSSVIVANQINDGSSCNIVAPTSSKPTESQQQEQAKQQRKSRVNEQEQPAPPAYSSVNERVFKFNQNLPSPSQILSETKLTRRNQELKQQQPVESGEMTVTRSIAGVRGRSRLDEQGPRRDEAQIGQVHEQKTLANEPENDPQTDGNNRLSIYENVNPNEDIKRRQQQEETTTDQAELQYLVSKRTIAFNSDNNIQVQTEPTSEATKKDDKITTTITTNAGLKKKPEPPAKPQQKTLERALNSTKARELRADERGQQQDDWSVEPDEKLVERMILSRVPTREPPVKATDQQEKTPASAPKAVVTSSWSRRTERKLVPMTSIIHEPEDDLMNLEPSATAKSSTTSGADLERASPSPEKNKQQQQEQERDVWPPGDRRHSNMSNFSIQNDNNSDNESDSSLIGGYGRRRLENKLKKQQQQQQGSQLKKPPVPGRPPNLPRAGGDTSGGGGSLVRRLARNFDQTIKEQPASVPSALRHRSDDRAGGTGQLQQQQAVSASTATNRQQGAQETSLADEPKSDSTWYDAKSVELLDEAEVAELLREFESDGQLSNSEQYVTLSRDQTGRRDERVRGSRGQRREDGDAAGQEEEDDDDDDPTLNDDETLNDANDEENDDQRDGDDDDLLDETFGGQGEEEESVYASAATNQNMSPETSCGANSNNNKIRTEVGSRVGEFERENGRGAGVLVPAAVSASVAADRARHSRPIDHEGDDSAAADRCRRPAASNDDGGNCGDQRHREACSSGKLVVVCDDDDSDSDHDDNDAEARGHANDCSNVTPYSEASTQRTNENTLLALPQLGSNHLTNTKTQPQLDNRNREGEDYKNKQRPEQLQQPGAVDNMGPQLAVASGQTKGSAQVELERETSGGAGDKQIFSNRLLAAFQATKTTTSEAGAFETKTTTANARTTTTTTTETATDTSEDQTVNDHHHHHHHRDQDQEDASSMVGELSCSEQSSSYREDLISLSSSSLSSESMPELRQRKNLQRLYNIVNEICTSEEKFVATLKLLNESFRQHILANVNQTSGGEQGVTSSSTLTTTATNNIQQQLQPPFDCIGLILKHLPQLQALNESLLDELRQARNQWPSTQKISHVLVKIGPFLKHYSSYIRDFECIQQQFQDNLKKSAQFRDVIKRFERDHSDRCGQLSIQHHLLKPIQRIPQYRLLLQQYLHHLKPDDADYEDTVSALEVVSRVAEHANHSLSEGANFAKLLALQAKIVGGKQRRDLIQPGRLLIREGELLKVCRKQIQPRWFVLLSDSLLYLKQIQSNDILYLKYELPLDDCQVELPAAEEAGSGVVESSSAAGDQDNTGQQQRQQQEEEGRELELNICTTVRSMTLIAKSRQERDDWFEALRSAIENHVAKRRSFRSGAAATANSTDATQQQQQQQQQLVTEEALNDLIGRKAPIWTPDSRVTHCQLCTSNFSALFRRHHCRACGRVVCSACSSNKAPLIYLKCKAARVCDQCFESLRANMHLYYLPACQIDERELRRLDEHFKTLLKSQFVKRRMFSSGSDRRATTKSKVILVKGLQKSIGNKE